MLLAYLFFWSLGLSMIGILLATLTKRRFAHVFLSVAFVGGLLWLFVYRDCRYVDPDDSDELFVFGFAASSGLTVLVVATFYVTFFALAYFAAAGMISFASENRSTPLRICMLVQAAAIVGWMAYGWIRVELRRCMVVCSLAMAIDLLVRHGNDADGGAARHVAAREAAIAAKHLWPDVFFLAESGTGERVHVRRRATPTAMALICFIGTIVSIAPGRGGPDRRHG